MFHLIFGLLLLIHPIYISSTNVTIDKKKIDIKVKLFRDDFEDGLRNFHGFSISIDSYIKLEKNKEFIHEYINDKLRIIINNEKINFSIKEFSLINDVLEISFFQNFSKNTDSIKVINKLLIEVYNVQSNILFLEVNSKKYYNQFNASNIEKDLLVK
tara:strand:- start:817 stop:1287 length:471 start_codon:yes stop_codon:yes gene_type:complete